jgi:predicted enzyme related to lactoylglutathione lyase
MEVVGLQIELFAADLDRLVEFYRDVLGFAVGRDRRRDRIRYVELRRGPARIGATEAWEPVDPEARAVPQGVEIVLEVPDLAAERDAVVSRGWSLAADITAQPWGLEDFRLFDPEGHYLRVTTVRAAS